VDPIGPRTRLVQIAGVPPSEAEVIEQELLAERPPADDTTVEWEASFSATGGKALALLIGVPAVVVAGIAAAIWFLLR
jgi:hypothetical protein